MRGAAKRAAGSLTQKVAIIGAGVAGLACARTLRHAGCYVEVFEQDRIVGGRMGTTRVGMVTFDHGAQYITARSARFQAYINELKATGYVSQWNPKLSSNAPPGTQVHGWYVGTPGMSAFVRPLAENIRIHTGRKVHTIHRDPKGWYVWFDDETTAGPYAAVAVAVPAPEARMLLGRVEDLAERINKARMMPCWAIMVRLEKAALPPQDVYSDMSEVIRWIGRNSSKPGRNAKDETIVVHASPTWSRETEDADPDAVAEELWGEVCNVLGLPPVRPVTMSAHLWRQGLVDAAQGESFIYSDTQKVGAAGDWCLGRLAEHAYESGSALGRALANSLN